MTVRGTSSVLLVGVIAASLILAPVADARQTCQEAGSVVRCETNGSVSIKAVPTQRAPHVGEITPRRERRNSGIILNF
jgi:hypothetical protein